MDNKIQSILNDLYAIDPAFRAHEAELTALVEKLLASRPDTAFDAAFAERLKAEVLVKARELATVPAAGGFSFTLMNWNKFAYALAGVALTLIITIPVVSFYSRPDRAGTTAKSVTERITGPSIARISGNAFGPFAATPVQGNDQAAGAPLAAFGRGGGGGGMAPLASADGVASAESTKMIAPDIMPPFPYTIYEYEYTGDPLTVPGNDAAVYRRIIKRLASDAGAVSGAAGNFLDMSKFDQPYLQYFTVSEDRDFGYLISFNADDGSVSVGPNWQKWPQVGADCRDDACWQATRLTAADVPADDELLRIANAFLGEYRIDTSAYGRPTVRKDPQLLYATMRSAAEDAPENVWIPEIVSVVYPLIIEGKEVRDESGNLNGLTVNVNVRHKKVNDVFGLRTLDFESSTYALESDAARIERIAENGGSQWYYRDEASEAKKVTLRLGTPSVELMNYWRYDQKTGRGEELFVPALSFPILNRDEAPDLYRDRILVPLVKQLLDEREPDDGHNIPGPKPMPVEPGNGIGDTEPKPDQPVDGGSTVPGEPGTTPGEPGVPAPETPADGGGSSEPSPTEQTVNGQGFKTLLPSSE